GTILMSRCTTSSSNLRPMRRLMANSVFWGFVTAWRLAGWPTRTSPSFVKATIEGVVRSPSLFSITRALPPSMMATHEFVVPMPITFDMGLLRQKSVVPVVLHLLGARRTYSRASGHQKRLVSPGAPGSRALRHDHARRPQQPAIELVPLLHHLQDGIGLRGGRF